MAGAPRGRWPAGPPRPAAALLPRLPEPLRRSVADSGRGQPGRVGIRAGTHPERRRRPGPDAVMPSTWRAYGLGGDIKDPHDAILGAANLLRHAGAPANYARALYAYNPSPA